MNDSFLHTTMESVQREAYNSVPRLLRPSWMVMMVMMG